MNRRYAQKRLYLSPPHMSGNELPLVKEVFESNWIAPLGPMVDAFEKELAEKVGAGYAAALSSGTAALHLALRLLDVSPGDHVICPSFTFIGSVNPIIYLGAIPVFIDSDRISWNMDPHLLDSEIRRMVAEGTPPKAVIVVHLYGQCADMGKIMGTCREFDIPVIEDAAEALGAQYRHDNAGTMGQFGIFSFNGNKILSTSGGGALVSDDKEAIIRARFLASQAREQAPFYEHCQTGYNYRLSNVLAAIGRGQLMVLEDRVRQKRHIFETYAENLSGIPGIECMPEPEWSFSNRWLTCITIDPEVFGATSWDVRTALEKHNIESRPLWKPMHLQPVNKHYRMVGGAIAEKLFEQGLCLPSGTVMNEEDIAYVCDIIKACSCMQPDFSFTENTL